MEWWTGLIKVKGGKRVEKTADIYIYKLRSMYKDAEERKKELMDKNEMNVLKGDMSLVGTRPLMVDEFKQCEGHHKRRLSMKPGITGLWQRSQIKEIRHNKLIL